MYNIRFHGRGGQGIKTAARILGNAFFLAGFEVQDAPRYGAERRGAPMSAYVRAARKPIQQRGIIRQPDLVIVADDSLIGIPAAGVLSGIRAHTVLLLHSATPSETWRRRCSLGNPVVLLPRDVRDMEQGDTPHIGSACVGAATRLMGVVGREHLAQAIEEELAQLGPHVIEGNRATALAVYDAMAAHSGLVSEGPEISALDYAKPEWIDLPLDQARQSAPVIHGSLTSVQVKTGLWRTLRPMIDYARCHRCSWVCGSFCPESAIAVDAEGFPHIDYEHCKGCMICLVQCPSHAIEAIPETAAQPQNAAEEQP